MEWRIFTEREITDGMRENLLWIQRQWSNETGHYPDGETATIKVNRKSVIVLAEDKKQYKVTPNLLRPLCDVN